MFPEGKRILVVDNEASRRALVERILGEEGFEVVAAAEGLTALRTLQRKRFSLIVAALDLPGTLDGLATVRQARARQPGLRALFTADFVPRKRCDDPELDDFIAFPFHRRELLGCVFELLQRNPASDVADLARRCRTLPHAS
ncbi:MAG TPA: response regulator [Stellaceae bacterium]|nr:response regulator [Stellaceae bacterium]